MDPIDKQAKFADNFASAFALDPVVSMASKERNDDQLEEIDTMNMRTYHEYLPLLSIPTVALEKILSYLSFDQVAQMRVICRR